MKANKLKSGKWRARAYDYTDNTGVKHYKSFTADSKKEAERMATEYMYRREPIKINTKATVGELVDKYIESKRPLLSPTTIHAYTRYREFAFPDLMEVYAHKITDTMLENAIKDEMHRISPHGKPLSAKTIKNEYSLIRSALKKYAPNVNTQVDLPHVVVQIPKLPEAEQVFDAVKGTSIELAVLLAMWLSFSMSEIKGLKRSSIDGDYIQIDQVMVKVGTQHIEKELAKVDTRIRRHRIPPYIARLIDALPKNQEYLVPYTANILNHRLKKCLMAKGYREISFHKLRHINASTMALLQVPQKYAQERGGWKTPDTMEKVYQHTFDKERVAVDNMIDDYFNDIVGGEKKKMRYNEFLKVMEIKDSEKSKDLYNQLMALSS